jgi:hypothetical protein
MKESCRVVALSETSSFGSSDAALISDEFSLSVVVPGDFSLEPRALCQTSSSGLSTMRKG